VLCLFAFWFWGYSPSEGVWGTCGILWRVKISIWSYSTTTNLTTWCELAPTVMTEE
jgi:hypothetical protein